MMELKAGKLVLYAHLRESEEESVSTASPKKSIKVNKQTNISGMGNPDIVRDRQRFFPGYSG